MAKDAKRIYRRLPLLIALLMLATAGIGAGIVSALDNRLVAATGNSLGLLAADIARTLDQTLFERYGDLQIAARAFGESVRDAETQTQYLNRLKETYLYYRWLGVTNARGRIVAATDPGSVGEDRSGTEWFQAVAGGMGVHLQDVSVSEEAGGVRAVGFSARITGVHGEFLGVVRGQVGLSELEDVFRRAIQTFLRPHEGGRVEWQFVSRDGSLILDSLLREEGRVNLQQLGLPSARLSAAAPPGFVEEFHPRRHVPVVTGYAQSEGYGEFPGFQWGILVRMDRDEIRAPVRTFLWKVSAAAALIVFPLLGGLLWATKHVRMESEQASAQLERLQGLNRVSHALQQVETMQEPGLSLPECLRLVIETAVSLTGAQYGAVGLFDESGKHLVQFITTGMDEATKRRIEGGPTGRGLLGFLAQEGDVLRLKDLMRHPAFSGFPSHHPPMHSFLGVSIRAHGRLFGRIYLTEKRGADEFSDIDEQIVAALGAEASLAIENGLVLSQLRTAERLYRTTMLALPVALARLDQQGTIQFANPHFYDLIQRNEADTVGRTMASVLHSEGQLDEIGEMLRAVHAQGEPVTRDVNWRHPSGERRFLRLCATGTPPAATEFVLIIEDLTEQKRMEEAREQLTQRHLALLESTGAGIYGLDLGGRCTFINKAGAAMLGYQLEELLGQPMHALIHHTRRDGSPYPVEECSIYRAFKTGQGCRLEDEVLWRKDGTWFPAEFCSNPIVENGRIVGSVATFVDITERQRVDAALRESEERFRQLAESIHQVFWMTSPDKNQMLYVSPAYEGIWGRSCESLYQSPRAWLDAIHPEDRDRVLEAALTKQMTGAYHEEYRIVRPDGSVRWIQDRAFPIREASGTVSRIIGVAEDMTDHKQLEQQLRQSQKMEAVGQLAGGIAHDFNNLLTVINGYSEMLLETMQADDPMRSDLQEIEKAGHKAATLTQQLLAFSRQQVTQPQILALGEVIADLRAILQRLIGETIVFTVRAASDLWPVKADPGHLEQVLINLVVNARDAMPAGGTLVIETANVRLDQVAADRLGLAVAGEYVTIAVTDTGVGMDDQVRARLFEPFFTTKERGKGTGLGLATVYGIVTQSHGAVEVQSEPGKGATFRIYLPRTAERSEPGAGSQGSEGLPGGWETVLLVEDDEAVRALASTILTKKGYTVVEACEGTEALRLAAEYPGPIHLLLTDVVVPKRSGREVADALLSLRPETRVLYMSGYTDDTMLRHGIAARTVAFLQKPFSPMTLTQKVRALLDGGE